MFYNKLRRTAFNNYINAKEAISDSYQKRDRKIAAFRKIQEDSVRLIKDSCEVLNTVANTPVEIKSDINTALENINSENRITHVVAGLPDGYNASYAFLNGFNNAMMNNNTGAKAKLIISGAYAIGFMYINSVKNKELADQYFAETKIILGEMQRVELSTIKIEARISKTKEILNNLTEKAKHLESFRSQSYLNLNIEQRKDLGSIVNKLMSLSGLISDQIV